MACSSAVILALLSTAIAAYVAWITLQGFRSGAIEPITKYFNLTFDRKTQPAWFWMVALWNSLFIALCLWGAVGSAIDR
jgi:hypothetical protein